MENYQTITCNVFISLRFLTASLEFHFDGGARSLITSSVMVLTQAAWSASSDRFKVLQNCLGDGQKSFSKSCHDITYLVTYCDVMHVISPN